MTEVCHVFARTRSAGSGSLEHPRDSIIRLTPAHTYRSSSDRAF
jgi:hypothetical protein